MLKFDDIIEEMFKNISFEQEPKGLYDPLRYMISIGGKRIRPRLCLLSYSLFADTVDEQILSPALALEVFHSFTLMHDDIMDRSSLRRGVSTVWKKWNESTAILSGDVMLIDSFRRVAKAPRAVAGKVMSLFSETAVEVCNGQQYDMDFESETEVSMDEYNKMIGLKTAVLLACSAKMGAIIADASELEADALYRYGYELGMAFQVADDYLDAFGQEEVFGKPIGGDILNCKKSWLTVRTLEKISDKEAFLKIFNSNAQTEEEKSNKIAAVMKYYRECGVDEDAKDQVRLFTDKAMEAVANAGFSSVKLEQLRRFAHKLTQRAK